MWLALEVLWCHRDASAYKLYYPDVKEHVWYETQHIFFDIFH